MNYTNPFQSDYGQEMDYRQAFDGKPYAFQCVFHELERALHEQFPYKETTDIFRLLRDNLKCQKAGRYYLFRLFSRSARVPVGVKHYEKYIHPLILPFWPVESPTIDRKKNNIKILQSNKIAV